MHRAIAPSLAAIATLALASGCSLLGGSSIQEFTVGQCVNDPVVAEAGEQEVGMLPVVDCAQPHTGEVFYVYEITDETYPEDVSTRADDLCYDAFEPFVGISYDESTLYLTSLYPSPDSWGAGDRQIVCLIVDGEGEAMTGSAKGSGL